MSELESQSFPHDALAIYGIGEGLTPRIENVADQYIIQHSIVLPEWER